MFIVFPGIFKKTKKRKTGYILHNHLEVLFYEFFLSIKFYTETKAITKAQKLYSLILIRSMGCFSGFLPLGLLVLYADITLIIVISKFMYQLKIQTFIRVKKCLCYFMYKCSELSLDR